MPFMGWPRRSLSSQRLLLLLLLSLFLLLAGLVPSSRMVLVAAETVVSDATDPSMSESTTTTTTTKDTTDDNNSTAAIASDTDTATSTPVCGLWFAKSTIPGGGLGIFAGRDFAKQEPVLPGNGDLVVPLIDLDAAQQGKTFLWDEYTWDADAIGMAHEGALVDGASFGFGAAVNCFLDLTNVREGHPSFDSLGLHRAKDAHAGAMTNYRNRQVWAKAEIEAGAELFVSYGDEWFELRAKSLPPVPLSGHVLKANVLMNKYKSLCKRHGDTHPALLKDLYESFVWKNPFSDESRILFAVPKTWEETEKVWEYGSLKRYLRDVHSRPLEWIEENGACGDNIREGPSDLAVRGGLATRPLAKDSVVAPLPMIHLPYKQILATPTLKQHQKIGKVRPKPPYQQLLNYCFGHANTTMLLCPYGTMSSLVNHNQTRANTKVQWADPSRSNHQPEWLNMTPRQLDEAKLSAGLAMELVATRDIKEGEEILLDYGDDFERAWQAHVKQWKPHVDKEYTVSSDYDILAKEGHWRTAHEDPYPINLQLHYDEAFDSHSTWKIHWKKGKLEKYVKDMDDVKRPCVITRRLKDADKNIWYDGFILPSDPNSKKTPKKFRSLPHQAFSLRDKRYTTDVHLPKAFRHPIGIPNDLLPDAWKNAGTEGVPEPTVDRVDVVFRHHSKPTNTGDGTVLKNDVVFKSQAKAPKLAPSVVTDDEEGQETTIYYVDEEAGYYNEEGDDEDEDEYDDEEDEDEYDEDEDEYEEDYEEDYEDEGEYEYEYEDEEADGEGHDEL